MVNDKVSLRSLKNVEELLKVQELEQIIWDKESSVPIHQSLTAIKNGGMVLGAFVNNQLVGFQYSFAGYNGQMIYLCSHMLGIHPDYRHRGIGRLLKELQREEAKKMGYKLITWTYDPLESVNGYLNIGKLRGITSTYIENCYGDMEDPLNRGLASDRFLLEWWLESEHVKKSEQDVEKELSLEQVVFINKWTMNDNGFPVSSFSLDLENDPLNDTLCVAIPAKFQKLKKQDLALAIDWRMQTRTIFKYFFAQGWTVVDFIKNRNNDAVHFYVLKKNVSIKGE